MGYWGRTLREPAILRGVRHFSRHFFEIVAVQIRDPRCKQGVCGIARMGLRRERRGQLGGAVQLLVASEAAAMCRAGALAEN